MAQAGAIDIYERSYWWDLNETYSTSIRTSGSASETYNMQWPIDSGDPNSFLMTPGDPNSQLVWGVFDANVIIVTPDPCDPNVVTISLPDRTPGSIIFVDANNYPVWEDNTNLYYDDVNDRVGIALGHIAGDPRPNNYIQAYSLLDFEPDLYNVTIGMGEDDTTTGTDNTRLGYHSGYSLTTGLQNTLGGKGAGRFLEADSNNTGVGYMVIGAVSEPGIEPYPDPPPHTVPIYDVYDLNDIRNDCTANYYLANDIDATDTEDAAWNGGSGWVPIPIFTGSLDGCGYTITGLYSNDTSPGGDWGLFASLSGAEVVNLKFEEAYSRHCGASQGILSGLISSDTLVSNVRITDSNILSTTSIVGNSGGLAYEISDSNISDCYLDITYYSNKSFSGGFAQNVIGGSNITRCGVEGSFSYASTDTASSGAAGFVRYANSSTFTDCYSNLAITIYRGGRQTAAFVSVGLDDCTFTRCYAMGSIEQGSGFSGWTVGHNFPIQPTGGGFLGCKPTAGHEPDFFNCYWFTDLTGNEYPDAGENETQGLRIDGNPSGGSFTLTYDGDTTAAIGRNASNAEIQSACDTAFGEIFTVVKAYDGFRWQYGNDIGIHWNKDSTERQDIGNAVLTADISALTGASNFRVAVYNDGVTPYEPDGLNGVTSSGGTDNVTAIGIYAAARLRDTGNVLALGSYSGNYNIADSNTFFLDNLDRGDYDGNKEKGMMYGYFAEDPNGQTLRINVGELDLPYARLDVNDVNVSSLTASRLVATGSDGVLESTDADSWIAGTSNQITVTDDGDGTATISTPQDIHTGASPTFAGMTLTGSTFVIQTSSPPEYPFSSGSAGQIQWDSDYLYVCTATNNWVRTTLDDWEVEMLYENGDTMLYEDGNTMVYETGE